MDKVRTEIQEEKNKFGNFSVGLASMILAYFLAYNQDFIGIKWVNNSIIVVLLIFAIFGGFIPTINLYLKGKSEFILIAFGLLVIPCNYMWYMLWPNWYTKLSIALVLFVSVMCITQGTMQLAYKYYKNPTDNKNLKIIGAIGSGLLAIIVNIIQIISII